MERRGLVVSMERVPVGEWQLCSNGDTLLDLLLLLHQGILDMSPLNHACVRSSTNIGLVQRDESGLGWKVMTATRSGAWESLAEYESVLELMCARLGRGCTYTHIAHFDGWVSADVELCPLITVAQETHTQLFGTRAEWHMPHASVEINKIVEKYPAWRAVSMGPQISDAHSPTESIELDSIVPFFHWMQGIVTRLAQQDTTWVSSQQA